MVVLDIFFPFPPDCFRSGLCMLMSLYCSMRLRNTFEYLNTGSITSSV